MFENVFKTGRQTRTTARPNSIPKIYFRNIQPIINVQNLSQFFPNK